MRECNTCEKQMTEGYCLFGGGEYYCTDDCLKKVYSTKEIESFEIGEDDSESYWTEWGHADGCHFCEEHRECEIVNDFVEKVMNEPTTDENLTIIREALTLMYAREGRHGEE